MRKYIFQVEYGGLGDHLFYSPLPRLLKEYGIADKVYLSNQSRIRGRETYDLVWKTNPYLDGRSDEMPNITKNLSSSVNKIINVALAQHGIILDSEINPEIYFIEDVDQRYISNHYIDLNYTSYTGAFTLLDALKILKNNPHLVMVNPSPNLTRWARNQHIRTTSLKEYATLIKSAASFSALASGGATLSLALGRPCTMYYGYGHNQLFRHSANNNKRIDTDGIVRKFISRFLGTKNKLRIKLSDSC